ncbi:glucose-6-phosphate dehydrogenase [Teredinibacter turnerae]|uniref:Glucose-6-phosphate 1-dehydrogenase n=1 Tax=Teredinibacter turnerae (strain ATCC 39867 / T7901) TaxID=377629 RepID=C5BMG1_TERTT|nr:glucose-6-phosphate dehydrogenase [Teredinibacter turnerae]ACR14074.1 glucose-6-phosphate dehydrogenase [Teredinibacter turnerae T7901]
MKTDLLIIGGDGDLALRKLYPSLYYLELNNCMPADTRIFGMARTGQTREEFHNKIYTWLKKSVGDALFSEEKWQSFASKIWFAQGDATKEDDLASAKSEYFDNDNHLVIYLAIPPMIFGKVCGSVDKCGLNKPTTRLVVEKPLGDSRESFLAINDELARTFSEEQIFRIDHYLGKESVQNLIALRFANDIFEPLWNSRYIDHIQITVTETVGVGNRWAFYDQTGATRDMVQNHLLQVLCLMAMEPPACLNAESVRAEKLKVLNALRLIPASEVQDLTVRGQYSSGYVDGVEVPGYTGETSDKYEVDPNSQTETYVAIKAEIQNWRWSGVPIYLRTGKRLNKRHSEIVIQFKQSNHQIFEKDHSEHRANQLIIQLQPDAGVSLRMMHKIPGLDAGIPVEDGVLNFSFDENGKVTHDAYSRLFFDVLRNDQTLFVSAAEVEAAWRWVDQIFAGWKETSMSVQEYPAGSRGPALAEELLERDGRKWLNEGFELWCELES